ncbi:MAG: TetR/AcrR family transcriptional regulator [Candidatus Marinimicrobia bacterium]|jgi:AcrR family transcriptional regulator|nr:TetR/AcrR family transcriptional regulator [Candidatus Neomarinimicrobiota bacterium]
MVEYYKKRKYQDKKKLIIAVAEKFFSRFGLNKTTMNEIAKAARIGKATLYHYFVSKEHIFTEVIRKESQILKNRLNTVIKEANNPKEQIRVYIITRINYLNNLSNIYSALTDKYLEHYSSIKKFRQDFYDGENKILAKILQTGVDRNVFYEIEIDEIAKLLSLTLRGLEFLIIAEGKDEFSDKRLNLMTEVLLNGICK